MISGASVLEMIEAGGGPVKPPLNVPDLSFLRAAAGRGGGRVRSSRRKDCRGRIKGLIVRRGEWFLLRQSDVACSDLPE